MSYPQCILIEMIKSLIYITLMPAVLRIEAISRWIEKFYRAWLPGSISPSRMVANPIDLEADCVLTQRLTDDIDAFLIANRA